MTNHSLHHEAPSHKTRIGPDKNLQDAKMLLARPVRGDRDVLRRRRGRPPVHVRGREGGEQQGGQAQESVVRTVTKLILTEKIRKIIRG